MPNFAVNTHATFRPSFLSIPPSPHSPYSPLDTQYPDDCQTSHLMSTQPGHTSQPFDVNDDSLPYSPPPKPIPWIWKCHLCSSVYPLGVTRRCFEDGHRFCSGEGLSLTNVRGIRKKRMKAKHKRGRACEGEFDYEGWSAWGEWRREEIKRRARNSRAISGILDADAFDWMSDPETAEGRDCEGHCDYPSECRWERKLSDGLVPKEYQTLLPPTTFEAILGLEAGSENNHDIENSRKVAHQWCWPEDDGENDNEATSSHDLQEHQHMAISEDEHDHEQDNHSRQTEEEQAAENTLTRKAARFFALPVYKYFDFGGTDDDLDSVWSSSDSDSDLDLDGNPDSDRIPDSESEPDLDEEGFGIEAEAEYCEAGHKSTKLTGNDETEDVEDHASGMIEEEVEFQFPSP